MYMLGLFQLLLAEWFAEVLFVQLFFEGRLGELTFDIFVNLFHLFLRGSIISTWTLDCLARVERVQEHLVLVWRAAGACQAVHRSLLGSDGTGLCCSEGLRPLIERASESRDEVVRVRELVRSFLLMRINPRFI